MKLIYTPEDGKKHEFSFTPARLMSPEAEAIENVGGEAWDSFDEFGVKFLKGNRRAYRAALWVLLRRTNPTLKFNQLSVRVDEINIDFDDDEKARLRVAIEADPDMDPEQKEFVLEKMGSGDMPQGVVIESAPLDPTPPDSENSGSESQRQD